MVNRIAAGEVIERPAAAVKELVENALDAGATRIAVVLETGGIDRIEVVDNGNGMDPDGLALAVQRHATSKLADDDLVRITTLGFRGEALPSIGAAARLLIVSRRGRGGGGACHPGRGRRVGEVAPAPGGVGTRVVMRDLFYATPARRKFLKNPRSEGEAAEAVLRRLALAAPGVAMRAEIDGRVAFDLPGQDRAARAAALLGGEAAAALIPLEETRGALHLAGFVASPAVTRATAAGQAITVNNRPVADPVLRTALRVAYRDVIAHGRHPVGALWLDVPAEEVDVNVQPTKAELRFRDPAAVRGLVIGAVGRAIGRPLGAGVAWSSVPAFRPAPGLELMHAAGFRVPLPGMADAQLSLAAAPAARIAGAAGGFAAPPRPIHWAHRWDRWRTPTWSQWPATAA